MLLNPYLNFRGQAEEALTFYRSVLGGDLLLSRFSEIGGMGVPEDEQGLVMHGQLTAPIGTLMAADVPSTMQVGAPAGFSVSLSGGAEDGDALRGYWEGLSDGASIGAPLNVAPWGDTFGMLTDRFGIGWLVNISGSA